MHAPNPTLKQKVYRGFKDYLVISCYLWLVFGLFLLYESVILAQHHIPFAAKGLALINALALGKVMLIAEEFHFADRFKNEPLIYPTLYKSAAFALVLGCFKIVRKQALACITARVSARASARSAGVPSKAFLHSQPCWVSF